MNLYVDLGAHNGKTVENWAVGHPETDRIYAFEPNPACLMHARWAHIRAHIPRVRIYQEAAWIRECALPLYRCSTKLANQSATLLEGKTTGEISYGAPVMVPAIDFAAWLQEHAAPEDHVTVKMDIEGAEYAVLQHCFETGAIDLVDELLVEFHAGKFTDPSLAAAHTRILAGLARRDLLMEVAAH